MKARIFQKQVFPSILWFTLLILLARVIDQILHNTGYAYIGRYLGLPGSAFITLSFVYSLRKRKTIEFGRPGFFLRIHEWLAWLGSLMILVHAGIHMHAILPWAALVGMLISVASGFTGGYLQKSARTKLDTTKNRLSEKGLTQEQIEDTLYFDSLTVDIMKKWRTVHITITSFFASLACFHIISILWFQVK